MPRRRRRSAGPALAFETSRLMWEAGAVVGLRLSMLAWNIGPEREAERMVEEKGPALAAASVDAAASAGRAMLRRPFDPVGASVAAAQTWTRSVTRKARSNRKRLTGSRKKRSP